MPDFINPFSGLAPRKMSKQELVRALRLNIAAEHEAVHIYSSHVDATDDELAKAVLLDIANEERVHAGEFMELLRRIAPEEAQLLEKGRQEVEEIASNLVAENLIPAVFGTKSAVQPAETENTIGNLREAEN